MRWLTKIDRFFLLVFLFLQVNFFDLIELKNNSIGVINSYNQKNALSFLVIVYLIIFFLKKSDYPKLSSEMNFAFLIFFLQITVFIIAVASWIYYRQSLKTTIISSWYYVILLLYFPYSAELRRQEDWRKAIQLISVFSFILSLSKLLQSFLIGKIGVIIFHLNTMGDYNTALGKRYMLFSFTRIPSIADFTFFATLLLIVSALEKWDIFKPIWWRLILVTNVACLVLVGQVRMYIVLLLALFIIILAQRTYAKYGSGMLFTGAVLLAIPVIILGYKIIMLLLFYNERRTQAALTRFDELEYFTSLINIHGWFGIGFPRVADHLDLLQGNGMYYSLDDIGISGFISRIGYIGVVIVAIFIVNLVKVIYKSKHKSTVFALLIYILGSSISLSLFDPQRIFYLPVILALFDFVASNNLSSKRRSFLK